MLACPAGRGTSLTTNGVLAEMNANPYEQYRSTQIETAGPERLLLLLYDGAIAAVNTAMVRAVQKNREESNRYFLKAQAIIGELQAGLDMNVGEIARNLNALYDYFNRRLIEANLKQDPAIAGEILGHLKDLRSAWKEAIVINAAVGKPTLLANVSA